ncbi:hypothetical protein FACS18949_09120 [Clostridia bacterium]|nr:hypothetical protein FACS18949_09120 [Clostridia bacterium]
MKLKRLLVSALFLLALLTLTAVTAFASEAKIGELTGSKVRFRSDPSTSGAELGLFNLGDQVLITDKVTRAGMVWYEVISGYRLGYVAADYIAVKPDKDYAIGDGITNGSKLNVRTAPNTAAKPITQLDMGVRVTIIGVSQGWYKVTLASEETGFIHADFLDVAPAGGAAITPKAAYAAVSAAYQYPVTEDIEGLRGELIAFAKNYIGTPYASGSMDPARGFDCSGFTTFVFKKFGYSLNRSSHDQILNGTAVSKAELQPGDLVLFRDTAITTKAASHAGIYIGNGQFIHSSSPSGGGVKISGMNESYYAKWYVAGRRVLP